MPGPIFGLQQVQMLNAVYAANSGGSTTGLDISPAIGDIFLMIDDRAGGTAAATLTVEHSDSLSTGYTTVPASAIVSVPTGQPFAFANLSTAASNQKAAINRQQLRKYLRVTTAGTTITHNLAMTISYAVENTGEIT